MLAYSTWLQAELEFGDGWLPSRNPNPARIHFNSDFWPFSLCNTQDGLDSLVRSRIVENAALAVIEPFGAQTMPLKNSFNICMNAIVGVDFVSIIVRV